jgi:peptidoglycan hydrolase-like protein with peptidoglycan-binding domain
MSNEIIPDIPVEMPQSKKLNYDLILIVTFMGVVSMSLLWSMSAGGSFRRPDSAASLPSPVYIGAEDLRQVPATVPVSSDIAYEADLVVAFVPTSLPAPAIPVQPRIVASEDTEKALGLKRAARVAVQRRLALAGFNPNGIDGVFGPRTRAAIAGFQTAWDFPATGYLEPSVYADLKQRTEDAYQALRRQAAAAPSAAPELAPIARERQIASVEDDNRCARRSNGRIIEYQSLACDIAGLSESFASPGRNTLENGEDAGRDR